MAAEDILGPNLGSLQGKTVCFNGEHVSLSKQIIPPDLLLKYKDVTLAMDIMFVNKLPFLLTLSRHIKFGTVAHLLSRGHTNVMAVIKQIKALYRIRGFRVRHIHSDGEFSAMEADLLGERIVLTTCANDEHVPDIEHYVRTVKDRVRSAFALMPFKKIPAIMIKEIVQGAVMWLNMFPPNDGVSNTLSPRSLITGQQIDYHKHCRIECGAYAQTHEEHSNDMGERTIGALALRPRGTDDGGYYFLSLSSGKRIYRKRWTELPMPDEVKD